MENEDKFSLAMWYMKALAILTVVMAHCTFTDSNIQRLTDIFGTIGVPIFLIIGGIYFRVNHDWKKFAYQKTKRIVVPWILWGGVTYLLHIFSDGTTIDIYDLFCWIIGYHTWLYYVPVVLFCYFVFNFSDKIAYIITMSLVSLISYILTCLGLLNETTIIMTSCQNPMNWIWLFGLGVILNKLGIKKLSFNNHNKLQLSTIVYGVFWIMMVVIYFNISKQHSFTPSYWNCISVLFELTTVVFFYILSMMLVEKFPPIKLFKEVGKNSYPIYFAHMQIGINAINIVCFNIWYSFSGLINCWMIIVRATLVIGITYFIFVYLAKKILSYLRISDISWIIGLKM